MMFPGFQFAGHNNFSLIGVETLEYAKITHTFNSQLRLKIVILQHLTEFVLFEILSLHHIPVRYTNVSFMNNLYFHDFGHTYLQFTMDVLTWYNFTPYSIILTNVPLQSGISTGRTLFQVMKMSPLLIKRHIRSLIISLQFIISLRTWLFFRVI